MLFQRQRPYPPLIQAAADLNTSKGDGDTALIWVTRNGHPAVAQQFIKAEADLDDTSPIWVARNSHHASTWHFTEMKADLDINHGNGGTALI